MADKAWTDRKEFKRLHAELRALSRDAFADRAARVDAQLGIEAAAFRPWHVVLAAAQHRRPRDRFSIE